MSYRSDKIDGSNFVKSACYRNIRFYICCVHQLLKENYTVRDLNNHFKIDPLKQLEGAAECLELVEVDLENDQGWSQATANCTYVLHVASLFPIVTHESVISTAVDGTLRVLRAAASNSSLKKVVVTSSCAALNDTKFKLTVINSALVGPLLYNVQGMSIDIIRRFLNNEIPAVPAVQFGLIDLPDIAQAQARAMREPRSDGLRILLSYQPSFWFLDIANVLRDEFSSQGYSIPRITVPYPIAWLYSLFSNKTKR
ncbi:conserved hypothetical protein [Brugia malayi]|uniref:3Beta_HSD domain-containing protein n=1 Tax=Brugia malayi TaxID=6279 RepID=A0A4E9FSN2_BRUMA|nr:uncharacterized protein BM_BM9272 [Brugia malayi]VIO99978.1 conserved hypothetical protein [Brugia malayi]